MKPKQRWTNLRLGRAVELLRLCDGPMTDAEAAAIGRELNRLLARDDVAGIKDSYNRLTRNGLDDPNSYP